jgi:CheY-like chemotaxis protein
LLEDDGAMLRTFERLLSQRGVMVMAASTPGEALYYVSAIDGPVRPTVAFLDVLVPALDGPRFVQALRQNPHFATAPIVLVSGLSAPILEKTAEEWGVNGFILKSKGLLHLDTAFEGWLQRVGVPPAPRSGAGSSAPPGSGGSSGGSSAPPSTGNNTPGSSRAIR